jgi:hypothetical protein
MEVIGVIGVAEDTIEGKVTNELKEDSRTFVPDSDLMELLAE